LPAPVGGFSAQAARQVTSGEMVSKLIPT